MFKCGALVVNSKSSKLIPSLNAAARLVKDVLYVPLVSEDGPYTDTVNELSQRINQLYLHASKVNPNLDLRVILPRPSHESPPTLALHNKVEALFSPLHVKDIQCLPEYLCIQKRSDISDLTSLFKLISISESLEVTKQPTTLSTSNIQLYTDVALGGTFDYIHNGHRLLLTQAALIATHRILVGVANGPLIMNKTLMELIAPIDVRISNVETILRDCRPELDIEVVSITDVFGPTAWDGKLSCLVASSETASAIDVINEERKKNGIEALSLHTTQLVTEGKDSPTMIVADKTSSSELRKKQLGVYRIPKINQCLVDWDPSKGPYLIGLTGTTACGKSSITKRLTDKGAYSIPCDQLGHMAYLAGTRGHSEIIKAFGKEVLADNGEIDRKQLGSIVFADKSKLDELNKIVWPEIWNLAEKEIEKAHQNGFKVCIIDAAVLLQAEWNKRIHEVWVPVLSAKETIKRVMERDGLSEERAKQRLSSQMSGSNAVQYAHIILCTQWNYDYTQTQVDRAWNSLQSRLTY